MNSNTANRSRETEANVHVDSFALDEQGREHEHLHLYEPEDNGSFGLDGGKNPNTPYSASANMDMTDESASRELDLNSPNEYTYMSMSCSDAYADIIYDADDSGHEEMSTYKPAKETKSDPEKSEDESPRCPADQENQENQNDDEESAFVLLRGSGGPNPPDMNVNVNMNMHMAHQGLSERLPNLNFTSENYSKENSNSNADSRSQQGFEPLVLSEGSEYDAPEKAPKPRPRDFPVEPFPSNIECDWDNDDSSSPASFPPGFDAKIHNYGSIDSSSVHVQNQQQQQDHNQNQPKRQDSSCFHSRSDSMASDQTPMLSNTKSSATIRYEFIPPPPLQMNIQDACSTSSDVTPILSNSNSPKTSLSPKTPLSPLSMGRISSDGDTCHAELKNALLNNPSRNVMISPPSSRKRPEPFLKILARQQNVEKLCKNAIGTKQPTSCRDIPFAILFMLHLIAILILGKIFIPMAFGHIHFLKNESLATEEMLGMHFAYANVLTLMLVSGVISMIISLMALSLMTAAPDRFIPMALYLSIALSFLWAIVGGLRSQQHNFVPLTGLCAFGGTVAYTFTVWENIPFESANLYTALKAIRSTRCIVGLAVAFQLFILTWAMLFLLIFIGMYDFFKDRPVDPKAKIGCYIYLGLSFHWTMQILVHIMQACISGYINRWWFKQHMNSSEKLDAIGESLVHPTVHSFGSICFGSMFVGISKLLRKIVEPIRPNGDDAPLRLFVLFQEVIVSCIDNMYFMFHEFAFVYVGMYGYNFLEAGKKANSLFKKRGWTEIVYDDLLENLLTIVSLVIGGTCGWISVIIEGLVDIPLISTEKPAMVAFGIGFVLGVVLSNMLFSVITSSVHAVLCCFAGNPVEFQNNHPICSHKMREAWRESWPGYVDFVEDDRNSHLRKISSGTSPFLERNCRESLFI